MTLNITKKKIEKVLELFNHPQTRKIRKNRGKNRRRNNKSFNRKNGRKNLATSTLKKRGGHGHGHPLSNGGTVGVVLGGQVGGDMKNIITKLFSSKNKEKTKKLKQYIIEEKKQEEEKKQFVVDLINKLKVKIKGADNKLTIKGINEIDSIADSDFSIDFDDVNVSKSGVTVNNEPVNDEININNSESNDSEEGNFKTLEDLEGIDINKFLEENNRDGTEDNENGKGNETNSEPEQKEDQSNKNQKEKPEKPTSNKTKTVETKETKETKEIDTSDMLKVALASNYFTQYGILSGMLKMNQEKNNDKFDVMKFVQDPKLYAEFCNKMGFQFAEMKEEPVVDNKAKEENQDAKKDANQGENNNANLDANSNADSDANSEEKEQD